MKKTIIALVVLTSLALVGALQAQPGPAGSGSKHRAGPRGGDWCAQVLQNEDLLAEVGVTDEQVQQVRAVAHDRQQEAIDLRASLEKAELELRTLMQADAPETEAVLAAVDQVGLKKTALRKNQVRQGLEVQAILGKDTVRQLKKAARKQCRQDRRGGKNKKGSGKGSGSRGGGGPNADGPPWMQDTMPPPGPPPLDE